VHRRDPVGGVRDCLHLGADAVIREVVRDVLYEHEYGWYRPGETAPAYYGCSANQSTKEAENLTWRCGCGWTTLDHHNGLSSWVDHADHVSDHVVKAVRGWRCLDAVVDRLTS
jgi:hypothetical protein